jgi:hypothetical protein
MPSIADHLVDFAFQRVVRVGNSDILVFGCPIVSILFGSIRCVTSIRVGMFAKEWEHKLFVQWMMVRTGT